MTKYAGVPLPSAAMADARLSGKVVKRNVGFLRQWRPRMMAVTSDGFLRYEKKKGDSVRVKETDLVKSEIGQAIVLQSGHHCVELQSGQKHFLLGFDTRSDAKLWQEVMLEAADENAAGRRAWMANLRRVLTLSLRERREVVESMGDRDWMTEWGFCWRLIIHDIAHSRSLRTGAGEDFNARRRRLKRLYMLWLQFQTFAEVVAEIYFSTVQSRDGHRALSSREQSLQHSDSDGDSRSISSSFSGTDASSTMSSPRPTFGGVVATDVDVDQMRFKTLRIEYGSRSWRGHKRLDKEVSDLARFRIALEHVVSTAGLESAMSNFPMFPLVAAFSMRGINVVAHAELLRDDFETAPIDKRDINQLVGNIRAANGLTHFAFRELPELWVRKIRGSQDGTLVQVTSRYSDVLKYSLRSNMIHGILLRGGQSEIEVLSSHDVDELVHGLVPRWTPYLDLQYYHLDSGEGGTDNVAVKSFLVKRHASRSYTGDFLVSVAAENCRLPLDLKEAFVMKHHIDIMPLVRRLLEVKETSARMQQGMATFGATPLRQTDPSLSIVTELEGNIKHLLRRHIREIAVKLVTLGDEIESISTNQTSALEAMSNESFRHGFQSANPNIRQSSPDLTMSGAGDTAARTAFRRRRSSVESAQVAGDRGSTGTGIYVIDAIHLRQVLRHNGVNMRFLPVVFVNLHSRRQPGMQIIVASEIVSRIAKSLYRFRLFHDQNAAKSRWGSRKSRLIEFINLIMDGAIHREDQKNQFWSVDAPIWLLLGPLSSSFALADAGAIKTSAIQSYREHVHANPSVLLRCLLHTFQIQLGETYLPLPDRHGARLLLRHDEPLKFIDEDHDPKLALEFHKEWLKSTSQAFRHHFKNLKHIYIEAGGIISPSSELESEGTFFRGLAVQFRSMLHSSNETRLDKATDAIELEDYVRRLLLDAHSAACAYRPDTAKDLCTRASERIFAANASSAFPLEFKIALNVLGALSDRGALSPAKQHDQSTRWKLVREWLHFFFRPANNSQCLPSSCPHPLAEALSVMAGAHLLRKSITGDVSSSSVPTTLRERLHRSQDTAVWEEVLPVIERHNVGPIAATRFGRGNATIGAFSGTYDRTSSMPASAGVVHPLHATEVVKRSWSDSVKFNATSPVGLRSSTFANSATMTSTSRDRVLSLLDYFILSAGTTGSSSWRLPRDWMIRQRPCPSYTPSYPGLALMWGKDTGLSLDEEAKLSSAPVEGVVCRPNHSDEVRLLELPFPVRQVVQVSCGYRHTALITGRDQQLYTFGYGECGRLGHGDEDSVELPKVVAFFSNLMDTIGGVHYGGVRSVSCGREHTMVVLANGELYGFGWAEAGRLGTGESGSVPLPSKVVSLKDVSNATCGREHTLALTREGKVYAFGAGFGGRLGNGREQDEEFPVLVTGLGHNPVISIDAGECHSCAVTDDGDVFSWGFGSSGALGNGARENVLTPSKISGPWADTTDERVVAVACGSYHTMAYTNHGSLYGWGDAAAGQLGEDLVHSDDMVVLTPQLIHVPGVVPSASSVEQGIAEIACGTFTSAACTSEGKLFVWGSAAAGSGARLSIEDAKVKQVTALAEFQVGSISCGAYHVVAITNEGVI